MRPNRKARKQLAKALGLNKLKKDARKNLYTWGEMIRRAAQAGKQLHTANLEDQYNSQIEVGQNLEISKMMEAYKNEEPLVDPSNLDWAQNNLKDFNEPENNVEDKNESNNQ